MSWYAMTVLVPHLRCLGQAGHRDFDISDHGLHALVVCDALDEALVGGWGVSGSREHLDRLLCGLAALLLARGQLDLNSNQKRFGSRDTGEASQVVDKKKSEILTAVGPAVVLLSTNKVGRGTTSHTVPDKLTNQHRDRIEWRDSHVSTRAGGAEIGQRSSKTHGHQNQKEKSTPAKMASPQCFNLFDQSAGWVWYLRDPTENKNFNSFIHDAAPRPRYPPIDTHHT